MQEIFVICEKLLIPSQPAITCSKLTIETLEQWCEICSDLTIKTPKRPHCRHFGVFIINFERISRLCSIVSIFNFEQVNAGWVVILIQMSESFRSQKRYLKKSYLAGIFVKCS